MTLYAVQKFLYELNRTPALQTAYEEDRHAVLEPYDLSEEETSALVEPDIGKLFHLGVNGQIVGACVTFSLKVICQHGDRAVRFGARDPPVSLWSRTFAGE